MPSLTIENYVKAIYQECTSLGDAPASTGRLAQALGVLPGTVTSMLKTLNDSGLAEYTPYEGVRLTKPGRALALRVLRRHRLIELFLVQTLGLNWDEVHEEAEHMEHAVSDFVIDKMEAFLGYPEQDPHGDPIPRADGTVRDMQSRPLLDWDVGRPFRLVRVLDQSSEFLRFLSSNGLLLGSEGIVTEHQSAVGTLKVVLGESETTLANEAAGKLLVTAPDSSGAR